MTATVSDLMHLIDRAEAGSLLPGEAVRLRAGVRELAAGLEQARRTAGGLTAEVRRLRGQEGPSDGLSARESAVPAGSGAEVVRTPQGPSGAFLAAPSDGESGRAVANGLRNPRGPSGDSRADPNGPQAAQKGPQERRTTSGGPVPASSPGTPATATRHPIDLNPPGRTHP